MILCNVHLEIILHNVHIENDRRKALIQVNISFLENDTIECFVCRK